MEFEKIVDVISEQMGIEKSSINENTNFINDLGADSLDIFQMISELEEIFDIEFLSEDMDSIKTVNDAITYIKAKYNKYD